MRKLLLTLICSLAGAGAAMAQTSLADIQAAVAASSSELDQVDAMLADTDPNRRLAALKLLIASGEPLFVKRAKEVGLLSSDPEMQKVAVAATLDQGGPFRLEIDLSQLEEGSSMHKLIQDYDGSIDETAKLGRVTFSTLPYDADRKCWPAADGKVCAIIPTGAAYSLDEWQYGSGSLELQPDGALTGTFNFNRGGFERVGAPARIPLAE